MYKVLRNGFKLYGSCGETGKNLIVPNGLHELIADISRKVIQNQPADIITFIAECLEAQLEARAIVDDANKIVEENLFETQEQLLFNFSEYGIDEATAVEAAIRIQSLFRGYRVRKQLNLFERSSSFLIVSPLDSDGTVVTEIHKSIELGMLPEEQSAIVLFQRTKHNISRAPCITFTSEYPQSQNEMESKESTFQKTESSEVERTFFLEQLDYKPAHVSAQITYEQTLDSYRESVTGKERKITQQNIPTLPEHSIDEDIDGISIKSVRQEANLLKEFIDDEEDNFSITIEKSQESVKSHRMFDESHGTLNGKSDVSEYVTIRKESIKQTRNEQVSVDRKASSEDVRQETETLFDEAEQRIENRIKSLLKQEKEEAIGRNTISTIDEKSALKDHTTSLNDYNSNDRISEASIRKSMQSNNNKSGTEIILDEKSQSGSVNSNRHDFISTELTYDDLKDNSDTNRECKASTPSSSQRERIDVGDLVLGRIVQPPATTGKFPCVKTCTGVQTEKEVSEIHINDTLLNKQIFTPEDIACQQIVSLVRQRILEYKYGKVQLNKFKKLVCPQHYELDQESEHLMQQQSFEEFLRSRIYEGDIICPSSNHSLIQGFEQPEVDRMYESFPRQSYSSGKESLHDTEMFQRFKLKQTCKDVRDGKLKTDRSSNDDDTTQQQSYGVEHFTDLKAYKDFKTARTSQNNYQDPSSKQRDIQNYDSENIDGVKDVSDVSKIQEINANISELRKAQMTVESGEIHQSDGVRGLPEDKSKDIKTYIRETQNIRSEEIVASEPKIVQQTTRDQVSSQINVGVMHKLLKSGKLHLMKREGFCEVTGIDPLSDINVRLSEIGRLDPENRLVVQQAMLDVLLEQIRNGEISENMLNKLIASGLVSKDLADLLASEGMSNEEREKLVYQMIGALQEGTLNGTNIFNELGDVLFKGPDGVKLKKQLERTTLEEENKNKDEKSVRRRNQYEISEESGLTTKVKGIEHVTLNKDKHPMKDEKNYENNQDSDSTTKTKKIKDLKSESFSKAVLSEKIKLSERDRHRNTEVELPSVNVIKGASIKQTKDNLDANHVYNKDEKDKVKSPQTLEMLNQSLQDTKHNYDDASKRSTPVLESIVVDSQKLKHESLKTKETLRKTNYSIKTTENLPEITFQDKTVLQNSEELIIPEYRAKEIKSHQTLTHSHLPDINSKSSVQLEGGLTVSSSDKKFNEMTETTSSNNPSKLVSPEQLVMIKRGGFCKIIKIGGSTKDSRDFKRTSSFDECKSKGSVSKVLKPIKQVTQYDKFDDLGVELDNKLYTTPEKTENESNESRTLYTISEKTEPESEFQAHDDDDLIKIDHEASELLLTESNNGSEMVGEFKSDEGSFEEESKQSDEYTSFVEEHTLLADQHTSFDEQHVLFNKRQQAFDECKANQIKEQTECDKAFKHTVQYELCEEVNERDEAICTDTTKKEVKKQVLCRVPSNLLSPKSKRIIPAEETACAEITELVTQRILDYQCGRVARKGKLNTSSKVPQTTDQILLRNSTKNDKTRCLSLPNKMYNHNQGKVFNRTLQNITTCICQSNIHRTGKESQHLRQTNICNCGTTDQYVNKISTRGHQQDYHHLPGPQDESGPCWPTGSHQKGLQIPEPSKQHLSCSQYKGTQIYDSLEHNLDNNQHFRKKGLYYSDLVKPTSLCVCSSSTHYDGDKRSKDVNENQGYSTHHKRVNDFQQKRCNACGTAYKNTNNITNCTSYELDMISKYVKQCQLFGGLSQRRCSRFKNKYHKIFPFLEQLKILEHEKTLQKIGKFCQASKHESQFDVISKPKINEQHKVCKCNIKHKMYDDHATQFSFSNSSRLHCFCNSDLVTAQPPLTCSLTLENQDQGTYESKDIMKPICHDKGIATISFESDRCIITHNGHKNNTCNSNNAYNNNNNINNNNLYNEIDKSNKIPYNISDDTLSTTLSHQISDETIELVDNEQIGNEDLNSFHETEDGMELIPNYENQEDIERSSLKVTDNIGITSKSQSKQSLSALKKSLKEELQNLEKSSKDTDEWLQVETKRSRTQRRKVCQEIERTYSGIKNERQRISASDLIQRNEMLLKICDTRQLDVSDPCRKHEKGKSYLPQTRKVHNEEKPKAIRCDKLLITPPVYTKKHPEGFYEIRRNTQSIYDDSYYKSNTDILNDIKYKRNTKDLKYLDSILIKNRKSIRQPRENNELTCQDIDLSRVTTQTLCDEKRKTKADSKYIKESTNKTDKSVLYGAEDDKNQLTSAGSILKPVFDRISEERTENQVQGRFEPNNVYKYEGEIDENTTEFEHELSEDISKKQSFPIIQAQDIRLVKNGLALQRNSESPKKESLSLDQIKYDGKQKQYKKLVEPDQHTQQIRQSQMYEQYRRRRILEDSKQMYNRISQEDKSKWLAKQIQVTSLEIKEIDQTSEQIKQNQAYEQFKRDRTSEKNLLTKLSQQKRCDISTMPNKKPNNRPFLHV